jgi:hypothetical protein
VIRPLSAPHPRWELSEFAVRLDHVPTFGAGMSVGNVAWTSSAIARLKTRLRADARAASVDRPRSARHRRRRCDGGLEHVGLAVLHG